MSFDPFCIDDNNLQESYYKSMTIHRYIKLKRQPECQAKGFTYVKTPAASAEVL